jgi:hypothetical protein
MVRCTWGLQVYHRRTIWHGMHVRDEWSVRGADCVHIGGSAKVEHDGALLLHDGAQLRKHRSNCAALEPGETSQLCTGRLAPSHFPSTLLHN